MLGKCDQTADCRSLDQDESLLAYLKCAVTLKVLQLSGNRPLKFGPADTSSLGYMI